MSEQELKRLDQLMTASEVRHGSGWYLLAEEGPAWHPVGGPYPSRGAARVAKIEAVCRWHALPHDVRFEYYREKWSEWAAEQATK